jgi:orotidine-5'-phosphate decarboxylase
MVGGVMTHKQFLVSEGGYISDDAPERIFRQAAQEGVRHFVVPGTKIEWVRTLRGFLVEELGEGNFVLYAPGFLTQGGSISECGQAAGDEWHAIVGSAIYGKDEPNTREQMRTAMELVTGQIR